jgi:hypothetical protein
MNPVKMFRMCSAKNVDIDFTFYCMPIILSLENHISLMTVRERWVFPFSSDSSSPPICLRTDIYYQIVYASYWHASEDERPYHSEGLSKLLKQKNKTRQVTTCSTMLLATRTLRLYLWELRITENRQIYPQSYKRSSI